jgi:hypothetical protein
MCAAPQHTPQGIVRKLSLEQAFHQSKFFIVTIRKQIEGGKTVHFVSKISAKTHRRGFRRC